MSTTSPAPTPTQRAAVKVWGQPSSPRWSVTVYEGDTREQLYELVDLALKTYALVGRRLTERKERERQTPTVHAPTQQQEQQ
jgi:hypothetical protein